MSVETVSTRRLGLAAYIKIKGGQLIGFNDGHFSFKSSKSLHDWELEYLNSCCHAHDSELIQLRKFLKRK